MLKIITVLVVVLGICSSACWAATNRTTLWVFADEQISSSNKDYQACGRLASAAATDVSLVTTTYFTIKAQDVGIFATVGANQDGVTATQTYTFAAFTDVPSTGLAAVTVGTSVASANGNTWLKFTSAGSSTASDVTAGVQGISWSSVMIADYRSNTTIVITAWQDGVDDTNVLYNHIYMVSLRAANTLLTATTDKLVGGCTTRTRRRRSVEDVISPRGGSSCSTSNSWDSSLQDTELDTACSTAKTSSTYLGNAIAVGVANLNSMRTTDDALFAAAGTKFTIAASFGVFIASASILFSL